MLGTGGTLAPSLPLACRRPCSPLRADALPTATATHPPEPTDRSLTLLPRTAVSTPKKFVALGESYQVLSNERLRAVYDKKGVTGTNPGEMGVVDSHVFFTMLFGSERFEPYIGQLSLSNMADVFLADGDLSAAEIHNIQVQREVRCALNLASLLSRFVEGDELAFAAAMQEQACLLINAPFGETLVRSIGFIYQNKAQQFLGDHDQSTLFLGGHAARMVQQGRIMVSTNGTVNFTEFTTCSGNPARPPCTHPTTHTYTSTHMHKTH